MSFSDLNKYKALAIVSLFETGRPLAGFAAVAVLHDGAGVSYGFCQFAHRSGALAEVIARYLAKGSPVGRGVLESRVGMVGNKAPESVRLLGRDAAFKKALAAAAITREMKAAQVETAVRRYLGPAVRECERLGFGSPLSLAIVCDSLVHGSWAALRDRTTRLTGGPAREKEWVTAYVRLRDRWLGSRPVLAATRYRTEFFLRQIAVGNWELRLPVKVRGVSITANAIGDFISSFGPPALSTGPQQGSAVEPIPAPQGQPPVTPPPINPQQPASAPPTSAQPPNSTRAGNDGSETENDGRDFGERIDAAGAIERRDAAKSLWTTVAGSAVQAVWALAGLIAGVPREVWMVVAIVSALLMLLYLHRQIELGKIREAGTHPHKRI